MTSSTTPNVLFLVWDACRKDHAYDHAETLRAFAEDNLRFNHAVAPGRWSMPSHASLFYGLMPSQHGLCTKHDTRYESVPLVESLNDQGFGTYGVSANHFVSASYGFDEPFDRFEFTLSNEHRDGLDIFETADKAAETGMSGFKKYLHVLSRVLTDDNKAASAYNFAVAAAQKFDLPPSALSFHPKLDIQPAFNWESRSNTRIIENILEEETGRSGPFFVFSNYMDTHYPYIPHHQWDFTTTLRRYRKAKQANERFGHPFSFLEALATDSIDETVMDHLRSWYEAEVRIVDGEFDRLLSTLDHSGHRDNTLIIVTADHGERLGEQGQRGNRRMGHHESVDDALLEVPLVIGHPEIEPAVVDERVSLVGLFDVISNQLIDREAIVDALSSNDSPTICECPASRSSGRRNEYPDVPDEVFDRHLSEHTVVSYNDPWKVCLMTTGEEWAWHEGRPRNPEEVPTCLREACRERLDKLLETEPLDDVDETDVEAHLQSLGYL